MRSSRAFALQLAACRQGGLATLVAIALPLLIMATGLVVDLSRLFVIQGKAQHALDSSLLGAVTTRSTTTVSTETTSLFNANFSSSYMGSTRSAIAVTETAGTYNANFTITMPTAFMAVFGTPSIALPITAQVIVGYPATPNESLEVALVLDNSISMNDVVDGQTKLATLKGAAIDLSNIIFGSSATLNNVRINVVPFDDAVNVGSTRGSWVQTGFTTRWNDYVNNLGVGNGYMANRNPDIPPNATFNDITDAAPQTNATRFRTPYYACPTCPVRPTPYYYSWNGVTYSGYFPDYADPGLARMQFGLNTKSAIQTAVNSMNVAGGTRINVGLLWGWMTLSPNWQGLWNAALPNLPANTSSAVSKQIVLMTDGLNSSYGNWFDNPPYSGTATTSYDDTTTSQLCTAIKARGIIIYTIGFGASGTVNETLLKDCASKPGYYFPAATKVALETAFKQISDIISYNTIRLTQ